jgi:tetratricopeptide (TPR) repeat protein
LRAATRYDAARAVLAVALQEYRVAGDLESWGRAAALIGQIVGEQGTPEQGIELIGPVLEALEARGPSRSVLLLYEALSELYFFTGRSGERLAATERAADIMAAIGDEQRAGAIARHRGAALYKLGRIGDALRASEEAIRLTEAAGEIDGLGQALELNAFLHAYCGDLHVSRRQFQGAVAAATRLGDTALLLELRTQYAWVTFLLGEWAGARREAEQAVAAAGESVGGDTWIARQTRIFRGELDLAEGRWEDARRSLTECAALCRASGDLVGLRWAARLNAELDILEGRPDSACAELAPLLDRPGLEDFDVTRLLPVLAWAHLERGDLAQAARAAAQAIARTRPENMRLLLVDALRVQGMVEARQEHRLAATEAFEEALALARAMPYPYGEARAAHAYGLLYVQEGRHAAARERLQAALGIFQGLGARKESERVEQALAALS